MDVFSGALTVFDWIARADVAAVGVALCAIAALTFVAGVGGALSRALGDAPDGAARAERFTRAKSALVALGDGALDGAPLALVGGLLGGFAFRYVQSLLDAGRYLFTAGASAGLALGIACGALAGFTLARLAWTPGWRLGIGALCGLAVGLIAFFILFGRWAGYYGAGTEVGVTFGVVGLLCGALVGALLSARHSRPADATEGLPSRRRILLRTLFGGAAGGVILAGAAVVLQRASVAQPGGAPLFIVPGIAPGYPLQGDLFLGALYGAGLCAVVGAGAGALLGATAASGWLRAAGLVLGMTLGGFFGLSLSFINGALGGPLFLSAPVITPIIHDPVATAYGLAGGLLMGAILGVGCALLLRWAERRVTSRWLVVAGVLLLLGVGVLLTHSWFHPLFGEDLL